MLGRAFDDMNYALTCKQRQESLPEALVKAAESLLQAGLPERYWPVFFTAYGPDDDTNINAAELLYVVTGTPSELEPKPWATIGREVETLREFGKGKPEYEFLESSLKEVQEATQKIAMELRGGDYE